MRHDDQTDALQVWFEFMQLAKRPEFDDDGPWDPRVATRIRPHDGESFESWKDRCLPDFEQLTEYPVIEESDRGDLSTDLHLVLDLNFTKNELLVEVERILDERMETKPGPNNRVRIGVEFQFNAVMTAKKEAALRRALLMWTEDECTKRPYQAEEVAAKLKIKFDGMNANEDSVVRQAERFREAGRKLIRSVRIGRFPEPDLRADGEPTSKELG